MMGRLGVMVAAVGATGCGTTVVRSDGWAYTGEVTAADAASVTLATAAGPQVIARSDVAAYDLPGNGPAVLGGALMVPSGALMVGSIAQDDTNDAIAAGLVLGAASGLMVWGLLTWLGARDAWSGGGVF